jgi:hypothetical protein
VGGRSARGRGAAPDDQDADGEAAGPWSPDGSRLAVLIGDNDQNTADGMNKLIVVLSNPLRRLVR